MTTPSEPIFKIFRPAEWELLEREGQTTGSPLDLADGFIHFSTRAQLASTLALHFAGAGDLILADVPLDQLSDRRVEWEPARDGSLFPHLYAPLRREDVARHWALHPKANGVYALPDLD